MKRRDKQFKEELRWRDEAMATKNNKNRRKPSRKAPTEGWGMEKRAMKQGQGIEG